MALNETNDSAQLDHYLEADEKYHIAPLPVHLNREHVVTRIASELALVPPLRKLGRLSRLAIFYRVREAALAFLGLSKPAPGGALDVEVNTIGISTLGWIGDDEQQQKADSLLDTLMDRTTALENRRAVLRVFQTWGSRLNPSRLRTWVQAELDQLERGIRSDRERRHEVRIEELEEQIDILSAFARREVSRVAQANQTRDEVEALHVDEQIRRLTQLYIEDSEGSSPELSFWAAIRLVWLTNADPALSSRVGQEFVQLSKNFLEPAEFRVQDDDDIDDIDDDIDDIDDDIDDIDDDIDDDDDHDDDDVAVDNNHNDDDDDNPQLEADLNRATCLRAAVFFGAVLDEVDQQWLNMQEDPGTDLLFPRANWTYYTHSD